MNLMDHTDIVRDLTFSPDGSLVLVSASRDKTLRVWDLKDDGEGTLCSFKTMGSRQCSRKSLEAYLEHFGNQSTDSFQAQYMLNAVPFQVTAPDTFLCFASAGNMMKVLRGHQNWVYCCAFSPDSSILCSVGAGKAVCTSESILTF